MKGANTVEISTKPEEGDAAQADPPAPPPPGTTNPYELGPNDPAPPPPPPSDTNPYELGPDEAPASTGA
jgi:hypothetical protein